MMNFNNTDNAYYIVYCYVKRLRYKSFDSNRMGKN